MMQNREMRFPNSAAPRALFLVVVVSLLGCSAKVEPPAPQTYPVSGNVVATANQIPPGSTIQFQPQDAALTAEGRIEADGHFSLAILFHGKILPGATEGPHRVTILPPITVERTGRPIVLNETYSIEAKENNLTIKVGSY